MGSDAAAHDSCADSRVRRRSEARRREKAAAVLLPAAVGAPDAGAKRGPMDDTDSLPPASVGAPKLHWSMLTCHNCGNAVAFFWSSR